MYTVVLDSSVVEHSAVNRRVVGSNPTRGVCRNAKNSTKLNYAMESYEVTLSGSTKLIRWLLGQAVKTSPFHGGNTGSIPVGVTF